MTLVPTEADKRLDAIVTEMNATIATLREENARLAEVAEGYRRSAVELQNEKTERIFDRARIAAETKERCAKIALWGEGPIKIAAAIRNMKE